MNVPHGKWQPATWQRCLAEVSGLVQRGRVDEARRALDVAVSASGLKVHHRQPDARPRVFEQVDLLAEVASSVEGDAALQASHRAAVKTWQHWRLQLAPWWWQPLRGHGLQLRRTRADDADFWRTSYGDDDFARRFNRQLAWKGDLERALHRAGVLPPLQLGALHWVVCGRDGQRLGLASLTSFNLANARAEYSIGFAHSPEPMQAVLATLLAYDFGFFTCGLNKLTTYVYADNVAALHNSLRVGLRQEGLLKDHFYLPPGEFVDVHTLGLTRAQLRDDDRLVALARRWLRRDWRAA